MASPDQGETQEERAAGDHQGAARYYDERFRRIYEQDGRTAPDYTGYKNADKEPQKPRSSYFAEKAQRYRH